MSSKRGTRKPTADGWQKAVEQVQKQEKTAEIIVSAKTAGQKAYIQEIQNNDIVFCTGPAGTGKTAIAVGLGLQGLLKQESPFQKLIVMRPAKEACQEKIGYLPGDLCSKMEPWAGPVMDNMEVFLDKMTIRHLLAEGKVEIVPLAYARGRSFNRAFVIVDEAQNLCVQQMLMVLTRLGQGSKMVLNGDVDQSDLMEVSGLADALERLKGLEGVSFVALDGTDIVRHRLLAKIIDRYVKKR